MIRIAESWSRLPPHVREAITTLVDAVLPAPSPSRSADDEKPLARSGEDRAIEVTALQMAKECRQVIQSCLPGEEWQDADEEFSRIIAQGLRGHALGPNRALDL